MVRVRRRCEQVQTVRNATTSLTMSEQNVELMQRKSLDHLLRQMSSEEKTHFTDGGTSGKPMNFLEELGRSLEVSDDPKDRGKFRVTSTDSHSVSMSAGQLNDTSGTRAVSERNMARSNSARDLQGELEELFEEMRRLVGFERLRESASQEDESGGSSPAMLSGGQVGKEVVRHELRLLIKQLKKVSPFENEAEMRALERRLSVRTEELRKVKNAVKESEYIRKRKEEVDAKIILDFQAQNKRLKHDLMRYRKARRDVMTENDVLKEQLENALSVTETSKVELEETLERLETARERVRALEHEKDTLDVRSSNQNDLFVKKYEELLVEVKALRLENEKLTKQYEVEQRNAHEYRRLYTQTEGTKKRLEMTVKDLRAELVEEHHRSVNAGMEVKEVKEKFENLKIEFVEVKTLSAEQQSVMQSKIRELYEVQESVLGELRELQASQNSSQLKSLTMKTVRLRNLANVIFKKRGAEEEYEMQRIEEDNTSLTAGLMEEFGSPSTALSPLGRPDDTLVGRDPKTSRAESVSAQKKGAKATGKSKLSAYEQSLELANQQAAKDLEELKATVAQKESQIENLEARLSNAHKKIGESERRIEELRQNKVREARNFSTPEINNAQGEIDRLQKQYKKQSLFSGN
ncbi:hypothetical protein FVE85_5321 [Porphyridium purpureum]|uniref:Uncharacterized protein n=1 Tax=Porphyridium purpureum TaxID=35688 RepID=A0A5J4Z292_PORPP|nr:hypothetical protein FVE85_5321 [Porphyridium purpureum]|eukprot:POR7478..scf295_1